jgi:hypothetical protein
MERHNHENHPLLHFFWEYHPCRKNHSSTLEDVQLKYPQFDAVDAVTIPHHKSTIVASQHGAFLDRTKASDRDITVKLMDKIQRTIFNQAISLSTCMLLVPPNTFTSSDSFHAGFELGSAPPSCLRPVEPPLIGLKEYLLEIWG